MKDSGIYLLIAIICFAVGGLVGNSFSSSKKPPQPTHWAGRMIVGDGSNHGVAFNNIEIGMREDGVLVWRMWQTNVVKAIPLMSGGQKQ